MTALDPLTELDEQSVEPELTRVSILGGNTQLDVALPSGVPISALLPDLVELIESRSPAVPEAEQILQARQPKWTLAHIGQDPMPPGRSLSELGVADGDLLMMRSTSGTEAPALFDDVIDAVAQLNTASFRNWSPTATKWMGHIVSAGAAIAAGVALVATRWQSDSWLPGIPALVAAIGYLVAAIVVARYNRASDTATALSIGAMSLTFAGAMLVTPHSYGAPHLTFACAATFFVAILSYRITIVGPTVHVAVMAGTLLGAFAGLAQILWHPQPSYVGAPLAGCSIFLVVLAPRLTVLLARLPLPPVPTAGEPVDPTDQDARPTIEGIGAIGAMALPSARALERRAQTANQYLTGIIAGATVTAAIGALMAASPGRGVIWKGAVLAMVVGIVLCLRGRAHADLWQACVLIGGGALTLMALGIGVSFGDHHWAYAAFGVLVVMSVIGVLTAANGQTQQLSPVMRRAGELVEYALVCIIVPLVAWIMDLYNLVRDL